VRALFQIADLQPIQPTPANALPSTKDSSPALASSSSSASGGSAFFNFFRRPSLIRPADVDRANNATQRSTSSNPAHPGHPSSASSTNPRHERRGSVLNPSLGISFRQFLIAVGIGYFLKRESNDQAFLQVQKGFRVVEQ